MQYDTDMNSDHKELFIEARTFLLSYKGVVETRKPRITTYSLNGKGICHMRTMPYGIDFGFLKGAKMEDKYSLLIGDGKTLRVLPVRNKLDANLAKYYIDQAVALVK